MMLSFIAGVMLIVLGIALSHIVFNDYIALAFAPLFIIGALMVVVQGFRMWIAFRNYAEDWSDGGIVLPSREEALKRDWEDLR